MTQITRGALASGETWPIPARKPVLGCARMGVVLTDSDSAAAAVALDVARILSASVSGFFLGHPHETYAFSGLDNVGAEVMSAAVQETRAKNDARYLNATKAFDDAARRHGFTIGDIDGSPFVQWNGEVDGGEILGRMARLLDIIVIGRPERNAGPARRIAFDALLYRARRSVLIVPDTATGLTLDNVMIAFNGSAEATRAVSSALALLRHARRVTIVTAGETEPGAPTALELAAYLKSHGIAAAVVPPTGTGSAAAVLEQSAKNCRADLIVMGAYTHSHLRQMLIGGVTSHMIEHSSVPVLMAH